MRSPEAPWRLVIDGARSPAANMARDEAILHAAARGGPVTLRFYSWRPWAFSIGYFQKWADFAAHAGRGIPVVRRLTGGGAIYHADEITYSLVGPFGRSPFPRRAADLFEKVHRAIASGLSGLGIAADLSDAPAGRWAIVCFERPQKLDVVVGGRKLLGSAQRRFGGFFLQHGSLPLSANPYAPGAVSVGEILVNRPEEGRIIEALAGAIAGGFGATLAAGPLRGEEEAEALSLAARKYAQAVWNARR